MKNFLKKIGDRKIAISFLMSYIIVLIIPYISNKVSYSGFTKGLVEEVISNNIERLNSHTETIDNAVANVTEMTNLISLDKNFTDAAGIKGPLNATQRYRIGAESTYIYEGLDFYIENAYVIFINSDYYVSKNGAGELESFYKGYYEDAYNSYKEWYSFITGRYYGEIVAYPDKTGNGNDRLFYILSYMKAGNDASPDANIVVEFKNDFLNYENSSNKNNFFLMNRDNEIVFGRYDAETAKRISEALKKNPEKNAVQLKLGNEKKVVLVQNMERSNLKGVLCMPKNIFFEKVKALQRNYLISLALCVLLGLLIVFYSMKRHYSPINRITKALSKKYAYDSKLNEYEYLSKVVAKIINEYQTDSQYYRLEKKLAKNSFLIGLLKNEKLFMSDEYEKFKYFDIVFNNSFFVLAAFVIQDCERLFFETDPSGENGNLAKLIIENVTQDIFKENFEFAICENEDNRYVIVSLQSEDELDDLRQALKKIQELIEKMFNISTFVTLSGMHKDLKDIAVCYCEAVELIQSNIIKQARFLSYDDQSGISKTKNEYCYSSGTEQKMINLLMSGNSDGASELLSSIIESNGALSVHQVKCVLYDIAATLFRASRECESNGKTIDINRDRLLAKIDEFKSIREIKEEFNNDFEIISDCVKTMQKSNAGRISDSIVEFVQDNYSNQDLNVAYVSTQFNLSANYISSIFKRETGIALSEYINVVRIEHAKALLRDTHIKIDEIAARVGYTNSRTFLRVFNSIVGISTGEYRANIR